MSLHRQIRRCSWAITVLLWWASGSPVEALDADEAKHLLLRTGFVATPAEIDRLQSFTREQAVDALIASTRTIARTPPPEFCIIPLLKYQGMRNNGKMMAGARGGTRRWSPPIRR